MIESPLFGEDRLPEYHDGLLIVKLQPSAPVRAMAAAGAAALGGMTSVGLAALAAFERSGLIKRVVNLASDGGTESRAFRRGGVLAAMTGPAPPVQPDGDPNAGVSLVELQRDEDLPQLQMQLLQDPSVEFAARVPVRYVLAKRRPARTGALATPPPASTLWNLQKIRWADARARPGFQDADEVRVAVLDTGIDQNHPDLQGRVGLYRFTHPTTPSLSSDRDHHGHGTHVAGTIAARINNELGINGVCAARIFAWKIFDDQPDLFFNPGAARHEFGYFVNPVMYRRALAECISQDVQVINLSIGGTAPPDPQEQQLFDLLLARGVSVVAAMGNSGDATIHYPAAIPGVIAVGATSLNDSLASFSTRGDHIALCAPGAGIWSTLPTYAGQTGFRAVAGPDGRRIPGTPFRREEDYDAWSGTSMATPHVAGAAALLLASDADLTGPAVKEQLQRTAAKVPDMGGDAFTPAFGSGRLDLFELLG
jgi:Subtilase family